MNNLQIRTRLIGVGLVVAALASIGSAVGGYGIWSTGQQFQLYETLAGESLIASELNADMAKVLLNAH